MRSGARPSPTAQAGSGPSTGRSVVFDLELELEAFAQVGAVVLSTARGGWKAAARPGDLGWDVEADPKDQTLRYATGRTPSGAIRTLLVTPPGCARDELGWFPKGEGPGEHLRNALQLVKDLRAGPGLSHSEADDALLAIERRIWKALAGL